MHQRSRRGSPSQSAVDGESLQTDVMRFMAIIGFCLVAIMALVRDVSPPVSVQAKAAPEPISEPEPIVETLAEPVVEVVSEVVTERPSHRIELVSETPVPVPRPAPAVVAQPEVELEVVPESEALVAVAPDLQDSVEPAQELPESEEGLSLRFHSDRDFLRLITSGEVGLYLFNDNSAFKLARNLGFQSAPAPRQLYEVMPQTIPAAISASADRAVSQPSLFKWGVAMPARIEQRIASLVATQTSGQLVVDRRGLVRHEATKTRGDQGS